jgi:hypothetical protein
VRKLWPHDDRRQEIRFLPDLTQLDEALTTAADNIALAIDGTILLTAEARLTKQLSRLLSARHLGRLDGGSDHALSVKWP